MGIYIKKEPCGCIWEGATCDFKAYPTHRCMQHGGTALAQSAVAARMWMGPDNPYANPPPQSTTSAPSTPSRGWASTSTRNTTGWGC